MNCLTIVIGILMRKSKSQVLSAFMQNLNFCGYFINFLNSNVDKEKALKTKQDQENKQNLKDLLEKKAAGGGKLTEEIEEQRIKARNEELDLLWEKVRDKINDMTDDGPKRDFRGGDKATRLKFREALDVYDPRKSGTVSFKQLIQAFTKVKIATPIIEEDIEKLVTALEAWHSRETGIVKYSNFLDGSRESESLYGIFPKHQPKGPSKQELERRVQAEEDEKKRQEALQLERLQKIEALEKKTQRKTSESSLKKPLSKEELKRQQRDEQMKLEAEKKEKERLEKLENEAVKKEVGNLKTLLAIVRQKIRAASSTDIRKWFNLFDKDRNSRLNLNEFQEVLQQAGAKVSDKEASTIFQLIDKSGDFRISPDEFCDMIDEKTEPDYLKFVTAERAKSKSENQAHQNQIYINSQDAILDNSESTRIVENVDGLSQIIFASQKDQKQPLKLTDDESDLLKLHEEFKKLFMKDKSGNILSFDDILQMMQKPKFQKETEIHFEEFKALIQSLAPSKYSLHEIKQVFTINSVNPQTQSLVGQKNESYIPLKDFKEKFCTQLQWKKESQVMYIPELNKKKGDETDSQVESVAIDHILQGKKPDDFYAIRAAEEKIQNQQLDKIKRQMKVVEEPSLDGQSLDSRVSRPISEIVGAQLKDPKKKLYNRVQETDKEERNRLNSKNLEELEKQGKKTNKDFFMQPQVVIQQPLPENFMFDQTIEKFFKFFCKYLIEEANDCPIPRTIESYVDHYGKQSAGFINYEEFKEIFSIHVQQTETNDKEEKAFLGKIEEGKLRALFNVFDVQSRGKIPKNDFAKTVERGKPVISLVERLIAKANKGGDRFIKILREEFQEADAPFGCNGELPLNNFQVILADYDLILLQSDILSLEKQGYTTKDYNSCRYVLYNKILSFVVQIRRGVNSNSAQYVKFVTKIQAVWRGIKDRKRVVALRQFQNSEMHEILEALDGGKDAKKSQAEKQKTQKDKQKGSQAVVNKLDKKKSGGLTVKERQKPSESTQNKINGLIRPSKESKFSERAIKEKQELTVWIRNSIMEHIIESAFCYGESLISCRTIQKRFENRPVIKYLFPTVQEFQFTLQGVMPKSLQSINSLGQVIIIDSQNQLNQFDIPANRALNLVNLGTKPPLKHYDIIDLVCDQESGRIYTLNANWILEVWNIEQGASFPQKRLAICSNEGSKDYISLYYKQTFNNSKPRFLSLQESNQQVLIINTSCIDSSIVFVDPISFSILKKIQLRFSDFELPKIIRQSIIALQKIFDDIQKNQGKDMLAIFGSIIKPQTGEVLIKDLVNKLQKLDKSLKQDDLYKICRALDSDNSGAISLDEFLDFFSSLQLSENSGNIEDELQDELWPDWVLKEGFLGRAQTLLAQMFSILTVEHGITADQAFSFYDGQQTGLSTQDEFKRILKIFFSESFEDPNNDIEFLVKLANKTNNKINYRDFCKYLQKKVVRSFRHAGNISNSNKEDGKEKDKLIELEQPLVKQGSLTYILRKVFELGIDLSKAFVELDPNELNVIPRSKFIGLLLELPLGVNEQDAYEILENDLGFDNYGNVNYTIILNSDIYIALERNRNKVSQKKKRGVTYGESNVKQEDRANDQTNESEKTDNRKVVVEDLIFVDDLEILIYTTIVPKSSKIFVTTVKKQNQGNEKAQEQNNKIINLSQIGEMDSKKDQQKDQQNQVISNYYQLLGKLQGHKNSDPPSICYIPSSCCLVSGEKNLSEGAYQPLKSTMPSTSDPSIPASHKFQTSNQDAYQKHAQRGQASGGIMTEILIWNLRRDMIELFQNRPPWIIPYHKKIQAHNSSIIQIQYLNKAQLIVSCSTDQTIKFFDPVSTSYELTDPSNNPHAVMRPGYYKALQRETTKNNITLREVKRIYTGNDTTCFGLNVLNINGIPINPKNFQIKGQLEWLITCKLGRPQQQSGRNTQVAYLTGYGIERVQIEVPAIHHDDIVPPFVIKEAEELVTARRKRLISCFMMETQKTISKIFTQVQLQESNMSKIRKLFMKAILQRKELKYLNPEPLRQIYKLILTLPDRSKFKSFLASSGCSDKLSVSETFFYLQIFMQIHPLRTTQIEFEKSIQQFHDKHQRQFLKGVKRWSNQGTQKFADYLRQYGLDLIYLQNQVNSKGTKYSYFCTRERFYQYLTEEIKGKGDFFFSQIEIEQILNELDPFSTGLVQIALLQKVYEEEIQYYKRTNFSRPTEILNDIRTIIFPNNRIMLQQSLAAMDTECDGFLQKDKFIEAFQRAQVNINRDSLELLFNVMSENFQLPKTDYEPKQLNISDQDEAKNKVISLDFFMKKLFQENERQEVDEIEAALSYIKAALIYKGLDFSIIFAEQNEEEKKPVRRAASKTKKTKEERQEKEKEKQEAKRLKEQGVDMTSYYTRFSQQISKDEFIRRLTSLEVPQLNQEIISRLSSFLALNQKNINVIFQNAWLHHLRRTNTAFQQPDKKVLPILCAKILKSEKLFRSQIDSLGGLRGKRDQEKLISIPDLKMVLIKQGISDINQEMLLKEFTRGEQVHVEDLMARITSTAKNYYQASGQIMNSSEFQDPEAANIEELRRTDYFSKIHGELRNAEIEIDGNELLDILKTTFDKAKTQTVKAYELINVLKYNYPVFSDDCLIGLQLQLEALTIDGSVDYEEFVRVFFDEANKTNQKVNEIKLDGKRNLYNLQEYEELLGRLQTQIKFQGLDLMKIFEIFQKQEGYVKVEDMQKILDLVEFTYSEYDFEVIKKHADPNGLGLVDAYDFVNQITFASDISPQLVKMRWINAAQDLDARFQILEKVQGNFSSIKEGILAKFQDSEGRFSGIIPASDFYELISLECPTLSESDKYAISIFAIKGSRRLIGGEPYNSAKIDIRNSMIQFNHFETSLEDVIQDLRRQSNAKNSSKNDNIVGDIGLQRFRKQIDEEMAKQQKIDQQFFGSAQAQSQQALKSRIISIFSERDISFFDCFQNLYDPLNSRSSIITISEFKKKIRQLNLPLSVHEHRIMRKIADPQGIGKVDIKNFCSFFETTELKRRRLNKVLDKIATGFFLQGFNMRRAFALFDADGDGKLSSKEFRQGMQALNLHMRFDEIDDIMQLCDTGNDGEISYDEFISKMDLNIKNRQQNIMIKVEDAFFIKLNEALQYSDEGLYDSMKFYDIENDGTIDSKELLKVIRKLGIMNPDPHFEILMKAGRVRTTDKRISYREFSSNLLAEINKRIRHNLSIHEELLQKINTLIKSKEMSIFEFFVTIDVNLSGSVSKVEFKSGVQNLGLHLTNEEFESVWHFLFKSKDKLPYISDEDDQKQKHRKKNLQPDIETVSYQQILNGFILSGCLKPQKLQEISGQNQDKKGQTGNQERKKLRPSAELEQSQQNLKDDKWKYQACIKIHSAVMQKNLSYRRLFNSWLDKTGKTTLGRLTEKELVAGIKKLRAGLTSDEIDRLCNTLAYTGKELSIGSEEFESEVKENARRLESERSFECMLLQEWITQFNECLQRENIPIKQLFYQHDSQQKGSLSFENFVNLNQYINCATNRKDLQRIFSLIDRSRTKSLNIEDLKNITSLMDSYLEDENNQIFSDEVTNENEKGLKGEELLLRQEVNDFYQNLKETLETKNITLDQIVYHEMKISPNQLCTQKGLQSVFEKIQLIKKEKLVEQIINDIRKASQIPFEISYKHMIDFFTRQRINTAFASKGFVDPLIAQAVQAISKVKDGFNLSFEQLYNLFKGEESEKSMSTIERDEFFLCAEGLQIGIKIEDLKELFKMIDEKNIQKVNKVQFVDTLTFITNKLGGSGGASEALMNKSLATQKRSTAGRQQTISTMQQLADSILKKQLQMRQLILLFDINRTGFISYNELNTIVRGILEDISVESVRQLHLFFDPMGKGKISVAEVIHTIQEILNGQVGGGIFAFLQVKPIIQSIIGQLAIDCDKFFDELAEINDQILHKEAKEEITRSLRQNSKQGQVVNNQKNKQNAQINRQQFQGLSKRVFFQQLEKYGISLSQQQKQLLCQVFAFEIGSGQFDDNKLDYQKIDQAFEAEQQILYAQEKFYTVQWERRIFKIMGQYLRKNRLSIEQFFDTIDDDKSETVSINELKQAMIRCDLRLTDRQLNVFMEKISDNLGSSNKDYVSRQAFIKKFWSAYTYEDSMLVKEEGDSQKKDSPASDILPEGFQRKANRGRIESSLKVKLRDLKILASIQKTMKSRYTANDTFNNLDSGVGFLIVSDFSKGLPKYFDLVLSQQEIIKLFYEIDTDEDGMVKFQELQYFYQMSFTKRIEELEAEKERMITQFDIFDHLMKILKKKGITLEEMFDQIDIDKNQFIEVGEFHQTLEDMGFMITEDQVFELMRQMDENFDGRISYNEIKKHIIRLGFEFEDKEKHDNKKGLQFVFAWRDKGLEILIQSLSQFTIGINKSYQEYFKQFDLDFDGHLTPKEFRMAVLNLQKDKLMKSQIERIMHILLEQKKAMPFINIDRLCSFMQNYKCLDSQSGSSPILIDEDLFVYIVERYDGLSRLQEQSNAVEERASYLSRHPHEIKLRGLDMLANQVNLQKLHQRAGNVNQIYDSTLILLAGQVASIIRDEAQLCVLDPTSAVNTIMNDQGMGLLNAIHVPFIENSIFDVDFNSMEILPSGAIRYKGFMPKFKQKIEVLVYGNDCLSFVSGDGKLYKRHLENEIHVHRYLMGTATLDEEGDIFSYKGINNDYLSRMDIFPNIGKFEKKIGLSANDKEIHVLNELIDTNEWINLDEFVFNNGGILNIPLFFHTDAPLFIIRHWAKLLLDIIQKVHDVQIVLRCLNLGQIWISKDGQRLKLGHIRGAGKVNDYGYISSCSDIYLNLDNNGEDTRGGRSSSQSPSRKIGAPSSSKTDGTRNFSNACLDNPFIAPETIFQKFMDQTSSCDVWSFGMIMYCLLFGKKPKSFYSIYRDWLKRCHGLDTQNLSLPFTPPSQSNFFYDPFSIDFEKPFDSSEDLQAAGFDQLLGFNQKLQFRNSKMNFDNFIKCLKDMSFSSLFTKENSKKFHFKSIEEQLNDFENEKGSQNKIIGFPGESKPNKESRYKILKAFARAGVLARKNELGLILDLISSCLDFDCKKRPSIPGLRNSPLFKLDNYELTQAKRFSQNVILYRSPISTVSLRITTPLRAICSIAIKDTGNQLLFLENDLLKLINATEECIYHLNSAKIEQINEVLTQDEKKRFLYDPQKAKILFGKDTSGLSVSPNTPLAAQIIDDKVIDMLIFLSFRFTKSFSQWKQKIITAPFVQKPLESPIKQNTAASQAEAKTNRSRSVKFDGVSQETRVSTETNRTKIEEAPGFLEITNGSGGIQKAKRAQNLILQRMTRLLRKMVHELHSYSTPLSPYVSNITEYIVKFFVGEEYSLGSDNVLQKTTNHEATLRDYLKDRCFFRRESELNEKFKPDSADQAWFLEQKNLNFLDKSNYWNSELNTEASKVYRHAITESGLGQSCYPVLNDYLMNVTNSFEPSKIFSKQMNSLSLSYLIPMNRTAAYYNELVPLAECLKRLYSPELEKAGKRCALAIIRSVFQTGSSDKIKACLDLRMPKHLIHFVQDPDSDVRHECLLTLLEISKGLQDEDFEILGRSATNLRQDQSRRGFKKTAFDQHKAVSLASQPENVQEDALETQGSKMLDHQKKGIRKTAFDQHKSKSLANQTDYNQYEQTQDQDVPMEIMSQKQISGGQSKAKNQTTVDSYSAFIKRTIALIEGNENKRFINYALDLPNLNFLSSKRFLKEMASCFESPVFIAPLTRLLKSKNESFQNQEIILNIMENLFCGNEKVLTALNTPVCDTYMTLLRMLMQSTKIMHARANPTGLSAQMKNFLNLQDKAVALFRFMFEQRRPTIIKDLSCIGAASTLLREQNMRIPELINLPDIVGFFEEFTEIKERFTANIIKVNDFILFIKDLRCWVKYFFTQSSIPVLTKLKAVQRCCSFLVKVVTVVLEDYEKLDGTSNQGHARKTEYMTLIKATLQLFDWLCVKGHNVFLFSEETGRANLRFIINFSIMALSKFKEISKPKKITENSFEDLLDGHDSDHKDEKPQSTLYDLFPFTEISAILQNIIYQLVRKNDRFLNRLLSEERFGQIFGEQLELEYDFIRYCIDKKIESLVLIDFYVKKNEIRLNTFECLLRSSEITLKDQFLESTFIDRMFYEYVGDFREFNVQFSKIDLEFLAFRRSYPIRLECISLINTALMLKTQAPRVYSEFIMYARRHFLIKQELDLLRRGRITSKESTALLLFAIILESNEDDLIHAMEQEGAPHILRLVMRDHPALSRNFPILENYSSPFI